MKTFYLSILLLTVGVLAPQNAKVAPAHTHDILAVKFSPDDTQLISYSWGDGWLMLWEARTGYLIWKTKTELVQRATERYNLQEFYWSENGEFIVTKSENGTYQSWNAATGRLVAVFDQAPDIPLKKTPASKISVTNGLDDFNLLDTDINAIYRVKQFSRTGTTYDVSHDKTLFAEGGSWGNAAIQITEFTSGRSWLLDGRLTRQKYTPATPTELELRLQKEQEQRRGELALKRVRRDQQAAADVEKFGKLVYIKFDHYGEMDDPGQKKLLETSEPSKSKVTKLEDDATAIWLRIHNDSPLPVRIPTQSIYMPDPTCFFEFASGKRIVGLCDKREISIWHGLEDRNGNAIPYGFDFGSSMILLPKTSAIFSIASHLLENGKVIRFAIRFQNDGIEKSVEDYGEEIVLRVTKADLPERVFIY